MSLDSTDSNKRMHPRKLTPKLTHQRMEEQKLTDIKKKNNS